MKCVKNVAVSGSVSAGRSERNDRGASAFEMTLLKMIEICYFQIVTIFVWFMAIFEAKLIFFLSLRGKKKIIAAERQDVIGIYARAFECSNLLGIIWLVFNAVFKESRI